MLELQDGRRLSIPLSLLRQPGVATSIDLAISMPSGTLHEDFGVLGSIGDEFSSLGGSEHYSEDDEAEENVSLVWEDLEVVGDG